MDQQQYAFSEQFLSQLQTLLNLDTIIGLHPLNAPSSFPSAWLDSTTKEGWTCSHTGPHRALLVLPRIAKSRALPRLQRLLSEQFVGWAVLIQSAGLPHHLLSWLHGHASALHTFPKGSLILHQKNAWANGSLKTRSSRSAWTLWASPDLLDQLHPRALSNLQLDRHGESFFQ